jgi:hypothetical protein
MGAPGSRTDGRFTTAISSTAIPALTRLRQCGKAPAATDARQIIRNVDVPVIRVVSQTDVLGTSARRRDDSDAPGDRLSSL